LGPALTLKIASIREFRAEKIREFPSTFRLFIATHLIFIQLLFMERRKVAWRLLVGKPEG